MNKKKNTLQQFLSLFEGWKPSDDVPLSEKSNLAEWLEARVHTWMTQIADDMFGNGNVNRNERKVISGAVGAALDAYHQFIVENAPQLLQRRPWEDAPAEDTSAVSESTGDDGAELVESGSGSMFVPLMERAVRSDGTIPVKIIQPGWGSSGYYPAEVLERDGPKIFTKGTKMYWNHQTATEEAERPEGDLNHLAAELVSDARYQANGPAGAGLYADAKVFEKYKAPIDDLAPHIGVSIRAYGKASQGTIEGREGPIVQELTKRRSIDFVTAPGAGGQILSLFEAARGADKKTTTTTASVDHKPVKENSTMDEKDLQALKESVATLQTNLGAVQDENARLKEGLAMRDAKDLVRNALAGYELPEPTKARLLESLPKLVTLKDGALDVETFNGKIKEAIKAEVQYLTQVGGLGKIKSLGESADDEESEAEPEGTLEEAFVDLGLSEKGAKIAAAGR
jgi:ribosomal protein L11